MQYGKTRLIQMLRNIQKEGWTYDKIKDLIDSLWRDPMMLRWSGFENPGSPESSISIDTPTRTFEIQPFDKYFGFYQFKTKLSYHVKKLPQQIVLEAATGHHLIYFAFDDETSEQILHVIVNPTTEEEREIYVNECIVADLYFNFYTNRFIYFGDERHGSEWPSQVHWWAHRALNGLRDHGLRITDIDIGDGSQDRHAQFGITAGAMWAEDLFHEFEETPWIVGLPVYFYDMNGHEYNALSGFSFLTLGGIPAYNPESGPSTMEDKYYMLCHVFASNCKINPIFAVMGRQKYASLGETYENAANELAQVMESIPQKTRMHIGTVVFHHSQEYTNSYSIRIIGEVTPEDLAEAIAEDAVPYVKTGWTPSIQKEAYFTEDAANAKIILEADPGPAQHFVEGERRTPEPLTNLNILSITGMQYIRKFLDHFDISQVAFAGNEKKFAFVASLYWNNRQGYFCYLGWRMHTWEMESATRGNIIKKTGLELISGLEISINEEVGLEHTVNITEGSIRLADITAEILDGGAALFKQQLTPLEARRYYLMTYSELSDPEDPLSELIITTEWELQHLIANNVAKLSAGNQVEINKVVDDTWILEETAVGEYSAMWLIATLDQQYPLKWIVGSVKSIDLDEAKELNSPETLLAILKAAQFVDHYLVIARVMIKNITDEPYYELAELHPYGDGEFDKETTDRHVVGLDFDELSNELVIKRNAGLPELRKQLPLSTQTQSDWNQVDPELPDFIKNKPTIPDAQLQSDWSQADTGQPDFIKNKPSIPDAQVQSDWNQANAGAVDFIKNKPSIPTITDEKVKYDAGDPAAGYLAEKIVAGENVTISEGTGANENKLVVSASGGGGGDTFLVHLKFEAVGSIVYTAPYACKFTAMKYSQTNAPTLSVALDTNMAEYDDLTVTADATGLVTLTGIWL